MAESAVISLAFKLSSLLVKEMQLLSNISSSVREIIYESNSMRAFLRRADASEQSNIEIEQWVEEVRDLAFRVEDAVDEYIILSSATLNENRSIIQPIRTVGARHDIATTIADLKKQFKEARARFDRYNFPIAHGLAAYADWHDPQEDALFQTEKDLVGIEAPREKLIKLLVYGQDATLKISVVGTGGLGKTTLVNQVYENAAVKNHFESHAWINVSKTSKVDDLLKDLIKQLCQESCMPWFAQNFDSMRSLDLKRIAYDLLSGKRYVIFLDDLQSVDQWDGSKNAFPNNDCRSRVLVTTRNADVGTIVWQSEDIIYNLEPLPNDESWELFCKKAFKKGVCPPEFLEVSQKILKKCGGLPLAIVAIGGVLIGKETKEKWVTVNNGLGGELGENQKLKSIWRIISHSYHYLPHHLIPCFLYMGLFPEDQPIGRLRLIRLWVAEGFLEEKNDKTPEEVAESYLNQLLDRNMIQVSARTSDGREKAYNIHSLMREIILAKSRAQQFASVTDSGSLSKVARRLSLHNSPLSIGNDNENYQSLRSFLMFESEKPLNKLSMPALYGGFKLLAVLDLQGANLEKFPPSITELLNLRYLSLKDTRVDKVPRTICRLQKLETLDLKCTLVSKLPILELKRLRSLLVYRYDRDINRAFPSKYGFKAPKGGMGRFKKLQKLCFVEAGEDSGKLVKEIEMLTELQRLGIINLSEKKGKALCSSIKKLRKLRALSITATIDQKLDLDHLDDPPPYLQRLYMNGRFAALPLWIKSLQDLVKIYLKSCKLQHNPLTTLKDLPNLVHIELLQAYTGNELVFESGQFQKLKILGIREFTTLTTVDVKESAMPNLEVFLIQGCPLLESMPSGISNLRNLKVLDFIQMPEVLISKLQPTPGEGEGYGSIQHIPQVRFSSKTNNIWTTKRLSTNMTEPGELNDSSTTDVENGMIQFEKK